MRGAILSGFLLLLESSVSPASEVGVLQQSNSLFHLLVVEKSRLDFVEEFWIWCSVSFLIVAALVNLIVLLIILINKLWHKPTNIFILSITTIDVFICVEHVIALSDYASGLKIFSTPELRAFTVWYHHMTLSISIWSLALLAFFRLKITHKPRGRRGDRQRYRRRILQAVASVVLVWILCPSFYISFYMMGHELVSPERVCTTFHLQKSPVIEVMRFTLGYFLPIVITLVSYALIALHLNKVSKLNANIECDAFVKSREKTHAAARYILLQIGFFILCSLTFYCTVMYCTLSRFMTTRRLFPDSTPAWLYSSAAFLLGIYPGLNPIFLLITSSEYRVYCRRAITKILFLTNREKSAGN